MAKKKELFKLLVSRFFGAVAKWKDKSLQPAPARRIGGEAAGDSDRLQS